jgi:hypothetical protein
MKKIVISLILLIGFLPFIQSQTVDSIKVEQAGDLIKIHYKILNSNDNQTFRVTVTCSLNGGMESIPKSLSGDFGDNVVGGRNEYMVLWDVLKDVDEVKSVNFSVKSELLKDYSKEGKLTSRNKYDRRMYVLLAGEFGNGTVFGVRGGYLSSWGISGRFLSGKRTFGNNALTGTYSSFSTAVDLTKRIVNKQKFQMHLLAGLGISKLEPAYPKTDPKSIGTFEGGFIIGINRISISFSMAAVADQSETDGSTLFPDIGIGMRF